MRKESYSRQCKSLEKQFGKAEAEKKQLGKPKAENNNDAKHKTRKTIRESKSL